ncbi:MAG: sensor histidine kinase [Candidatus Anammoxibacter sp.]
MANFITKSLRNKLILFFLLIALLPIVIISYFSYSSGKEMLREHIFNELAMIAKVKGDAVLGFLNSKQIETGNFASDGFIRDRVMLISDADKRSLSLIGSLNMHLTRNKASMDKDILGINIIDMNGRVLSSTKDSEIGLDVTSDNYFFETVDLDYGESYVGPMFISDKFGIETLVFTVSAPLRDRINFDQLGIINIFFKGSALNNLVTNSGDVGRSGETLIGRMEEDNIVFITPLRFVKNRPLGYRIAKDKASAKPMKLALEGNGGVIIAKDYRSVEVLAAYHYIPLMNWGLVAKTDKSEAFMPINELWGFVVIITAGVVLVVLFAGYMVVRWIINPVRELSKKAIMIGNGDMDVTIEVANNVDEIGLLAKSFNSMTKNLKLSRSRLHNQNEELKHYQNNLEELVITRTAELKAANEQVVHAAKLSAIGKLSASIAHEFNNPICGIRNVLENVANIAPDKTIDETRRSLIALAIKECTRMAALISKLHDFHRPSTGVISLMSIHAAIDDILIISKKQLDGRGITIEKHFAGNIPMVKAVPDQINQVLLNLIQNADEAMPGKGGKITINTEYKDSNVLIHIKDTGSGIAPQYMSTIFEPFFTTKPAVKGTGLGLSISYGIIKKHNGDIKVESQVGKGTTFTIVLPVNES